MTDRGDDVMIDRIGTAAIRRAALAAWERHIGSSVIPVRLVAELVAGTLPAAFHTTAVAHPERPALWIDGETISHGALDKRAARTAGWLRSQGVARGDRVLVSGPNSLALVVSYLGVLRAGATVVLANPAYTETELQHLVDDSGARAALGTGRALAHLQAIAARRSALRLVAALTGEGADGPALGADVGHNADVALLAYTSGTTGRPKGVPLTHANLLASIRGVMLAWRWQPDDVLVHALPLTHQHGLGGVHATLLAGSRGVIVLRGPQVFSGYAGQPEATAAAFYPGGWFRSGDIGRVDPADGYLSITGRAKELIITGGLNVYPREVELALEEQPGIAQAAVVGVSSAQWGEEGVAFVILRPGGIVTPEDVIVAVLRR